LKEGLVIKVSGSLCTILDSSGNKHYCRIEGKLRTKELKSTNPVVVGDQIVFEINSNYDIGIIKEIKDRKNYIIRKSTNLSKKYHIIAANVDQVFLLFTLKDPVTNVEFIDRFLVSAEAYNIPVIIVFNKIDLYEDKTLKELFRLKKIYSDIGYNCVEISALKGINIDILSKLVRGKITAVNGNSGVGKSMLIKSIDPSIDIKIGKISSFHKSGIHTTSTNEMYKTGSGGFLIDTPGIKGFGLIDFYKEEIYHYFPEIFAYSKYCKFYNCTHIHEPDCAVLHAIDKGEISITRYTSYYNLFFDKGEKYRK
jgi:ribosome biogenesis GTPase / thiamine phosphate phosphatase